MALIIYIKRGIPLLTFLLIPLGCTGMLGTTQLPSIQLLHPVGYPRLTEMMPECLDLDSTNYSPCLVAAQMLESSTTKISTHRFLVHWENIAFGPTVNTAILQATKRIDLPVLKFLYERSQDRYSKNMLDLMGNIVFASQQSYKSFREAHQMYMRAK
jgi:hypothetical protein